MAVKTVEPLYRCPVCGKTYRRLASLIKHARTEHNLVVPNDTVFTQTVWGLDENLTAYDVERELGLTALTKQEAMGPAWRGEKKFRVRIYLSPPSATITVYSLGFMEKNEAVKEAKQVAQEIAEKLKTIKPNRTEQDCSNIPTEYRLCSIVNGWLIAATKKSGNKVYVLIRSPGGAELSVPLEVLKAAVELGLERKITGYGYWITDAIL